MDKLSFPGGVRDLRTNADHSVVGIMTGAALAEAERMQNTRA